MFFKSAQVGVRPAAKVKGANNAVAATELRIRVAGVLPLARLRLSVFARRAGGGQADLARRDAMNAIVHERYGPPDVLRGRTQ